MTMISDPATIFFVFRDGVKCTNISYGEAVNFLTTCGITEVDRIESILKNQMNFEIDGIKIAFFRTGWVAAEPGKLSAPGVPVVRDQTVGVMRDRPDSETGLEDTDIKDHASAIRRPIIEKLVLSGLLVVSVWMNLLAWNAFRMNHHKRPSQRSYRFWGSSYD